jgi:phage tail sheath protein FI
VAEINTIVEAAGTAVVTDVGGYVQITTPTIGTGGSIQVDATSTADTIVGLDNDVHTGTTGAAVNTLKVDAKSVGAWGNNLSVIAAPASSGRATGNTAEFNLTVLKSDVIVESFPNVSMLDTAANFVETVVNHENTGSIYVTVTDQDAGGTPQVDRPDGSTTTGGTEFDLASGSDGTLPFSDDAAGAAAVTGGDVFDDLDGIDDASLLACPDLVRTDIQVDMIAFCANTKNGLWFAVCDPPESATNSTIRTHKNALTASESYGLYWPWIRIPNPSTAAYGSADLLAVPPSGHVCGVMARNDGNKLAGPFVQPAGTLNGQLFGVVDLESDNHEVLRESVRDQVYPERINPITWLRNQGIFVDGSRTGLGTGNFPSVGERRGVSYIESVLKSGLQWVRHQNNTEVLRRKVESTVTGLLLDWTRNGAFASMNPSEAFVVDADPAGTGINNARARAQNKLYVKVGLATAKPSEYVVILVSQDTRALQEATLGR